MKRLSNPIRALTAYQVAMANGRGHSGGCLPCAHRSGDHITGDGPVPAPTVMSE